MNGLPRRRRLLRSGDFARVERQGVRASGSFVVVIARPGRGRVGFTVSKKVGNAVARNFVKRRLRDILRRHKDFWITRDLVVVARPESAGKDHSLLETDVLSVLARLDTSPSPPRNRSHGKKPTSA